MPVENSLADTPVAWHPVAKKGTVYAHAGEKLGTPPSDPLSVKRTPLKRPFQPIPECFWYHPEGVDCLQSSQPSLY